MTKNIRTEEEHVTTQNLNWAEFLAVLKIELQVIARVN